MLLSVSRRAPRSIVSVAPTMMAVVQTPEYRLDPLGMRVDVEAVAAHESDQRYAERWASSIASVDGADTAATSGMPANTAFWTISNEVRPLTHRK